MASPFDKALRRIPNARARFGARLRAMLRARQITDRALAEQLGCRENDIGHYKRGRYWPRPARVAAMAEILGVSRAHLVAGVSGKESR